MSELIPVPDNDMAQLPVALTLVLGVAHVTASSFASSKPGDILPVTTTFPRATATCCGKNFAEVEVVKIDGKFALRVRRVEHAWG